VSVTRSSCCRFPGLLQRLLGANNSNAYRPLPTDDTRLAGSSQQSNNAVVDDNSISVDQSSSAVVSPRSRRRRHVSRSPTRRAPALQTIPEERGEDDDPSANSNTNNSSLMLPPVMSSNSNVNNSSLDRALVDLLDADYTPPSMRGDSGAVRAWTPVLRRSVNQSHIDDDGFETVDLLTAY